MITKIEDLKDLPIGSIHRVKIGNIDTTIRVVSCNNVNEICNSCALKSFCFSYYNNKTITQCYSKYREDDTSVIFIKVKNMENKLKHKVGDIVTIKSKEWYREKCQFDGTVFMHPYNFISKMSNYCGKEARIDYINSDKGFYFLNIDAHRLRWTDDMFEDDKKLTKEEEAEAKKLIGNLLLEELNKRVPDADKGIDWKQRTFDLFVKLILGSGENIINMSVPRREEYAALSKEIVNHYKETMK